MLFIISGAAATGKSTVIKILKNKLVNYQCHDSDEIMVETGTQRRTVNEEWVLKALEAQENGKDFLLSTQSPFGEFLACPSAIKLDGIKCCILDCNDFVRSERYLARPQDERWPLGMDTLCWAVFHRMHAVDPQWEQRVIVDNELPEFGWDRWTNWQKGDKRWDVKMIDTSENTVEHTANLVSEWIVDEKRKPQTLTPVNKWWK
jgi:hypothetical protein